MFLFSGVSFLCICLSVIACVFALSLKCASPSSRVVKDIGVVCSVVYFASSCAKLASLALDLSFSLPSIRGIYVRYVYSELSMPILLSAFPR